MVPPRHVAAALIYDADWVAIVGGHEKRRRAAVVRPLLRRLLGDDRIAHQGSAIRCSHALGMSYQLGRLVRDRECS